jgi:hypothetical protein
MPLSSQPSVLASTSLENPAAVAPGVDALKAGLVLFVGWKILRWLVG